MLPQRGAGYFMYILYLPSSSIQYKLTTVMVSSCTVKYTPVQDVLLKPDMRVKTMTPFQQEFPLQEYRIFAFYCLQLHLFAV